MSEYRYKLPDIGEGVVEAEITAWHVALGDEVEEDAPIADAMTDKATIELTAPVSGVIKMVACEEGDILAVGADLVIFETEGEESGDVTIVGLAREELCARRGRNPHQSYWPQACYCAAYARGKAPYSAFHLCRRN